MHNDQSFETHDQVLQQLLAVAVVLRVLLLPWQPHDL
jgi:hypothetical protein